jgi:fatty acid desaturase
VEIMTQTTAQDRYVSHFSDLVREVRGAGLLRRRHLYYWTYIIIAVASFTAVWVAFFMLGDSWWQLGLAALMGLVVTQFGFLGHDAAHRQIFESATWNAWSARVFAGAFAGLSYAWWRAKHAKHHQAPNAEGTDPDIGPGAIAFTPAIVAARQTGVAGWFVKRQGWLFFPLLTLEGLNLHIASIQAGLDHDTRQPWRRTELSIVVIRLVAYVAVLAVFLPPLMAAAFFAVQMAVFGVCLGASFAPAHKGMPIVPPGMKLDFLRRQVLVSRNVRGNPLTDIAMGGLNYQIEHHLFPSMPRSNLKLARPIVRAHCERQGVDYMEVGLLESYGIVIDYLNNVGLRARDPFDCPLAAQLRG